MSFVATAVSVSVGLLGAYGQYQSGQAQAEAMQAQADLDARQARLQAEEDAKAESSRMAAMRDEQKRVRAQIEGGYAASGVVLEGTAADILTRQREADELNVQREHQDGNRRRQLMIYGSGEQAKLDKFGAKQRSRAANMSLVSGIGQSASDGFSTYKQWTFKP